MNNKKTKVLLGKDARDALKRGVEQVYQPVAATLGAKGRNSVYQDWAGAVVTNDGVTIARSIYPEDPFESLGADLIKQSAERTNIEAGDGTTTTTILTHSLVQLGLKEVDSGKNPVILRKELEKAKEEVIKLLKEKSKQIETDEELFNVAKISVEDDEIAKIVSDAVIKAGSHGAIVVEEGAGYSIEKEETQGYFWERGFVSPYMINQAEKMEARLENPAVIITDRNLNLNNELVSVLNELLTKGINSVFVVADNVEGELLQTMITNKLKGIMTIVAVKRPETIEELEDLAILTKGTAVTKDKGLKKIEGYHVGYAKRVVCRKDKTTLIGHDSEELNKLITDLEEKLSEDKDNEKIKERLSKLTSGIVLLRVGAKTEAERNYLKLKIDDAVGACKAAKEEGVVAGGGVTLLEISKEISNPILKEALTKPYERILENAGISPDGKYYNVLSGEEVKDMIQEGIIDPTKVERVSIENAISLAGVLITTESIVVEVPQQVGQQPQGF